MTSKGEQAKNQLIAAAIAQFGEYGQHATTRDIAAQAGQNIAAITYYFGSKEDLYLACAQWIADFIEHNFRPHAQAAEALCAEPVPDKAAMRQFSPAGRSGGAPACRGSAGSPGDPRPHP